MESVLVKAEGRVFWCSDKSDIAHWKNRAEEYLTKPITERYVQILITEGG